MMIVWYLKQIGNGFLICDAGTEIGAGAVVLLEVLVVMVKYLFDISLDTGSMVGVQYASYQLWSIDSVIAEIKAETVSW